VLPSSRAVLRHRPTPFGTTAINEHVIPTVAQAHAKLLERGSTVVPNAASARAYLVGGPALKVAEIDQHSPTPCRACAARSCCDADLSEPVVTAPNCVSSAWRFLKTRS
jgi:hypothetical protein